MKCPRCGAVMSGGICNSCGFPMNKKEMKTNKMIAKNRVNKKS